VADKIKKAISKDLNKIIAGKTERREMLTYNLRSLTVLPTYRQNL